MVADARTAPNASAGVAAAPLRAETRVLLERWRAAGRFVPRCDSWTRFADLDLSRELGDHGLIGVSWPEPYGRGASYLDRLGHTEEMLRAGAPVAAHWIADRQIGPALLRHGTPELQAELLPAMARAEARFCLGMSEPEAGSDLAAVRTRAVRCEGGWRLTGRKVWTTGAHLATHLYVLARTAPLEQVERRQQGLSEFIVDMDTAGIEVSPILDMAGHHHFNEVSLDDVFVPADRLLGVEGEGWAQVTGQLAFERGGPERLLSTYPLLARSIGTPAVAADAELTARLGELIARLGILRRLCAQTAVAMDAGAVPVQEAATTKLLGTRFEHDVIDFARSVIAAGAQELGADVEDALHASPGFGIRGGAVDVLLAMISKVEAGPRPRQAGGHGAELAALVADLTRDRAIGDDDGLAELVHELGLDRVGVPEHEGGSGGSLADLAVLVGEFAARGIALPITASGTRRAVLRAVAAAGYARGAYELTSNHVRTREQFGRPLIALPLVATSLAEMRVALLQADTAVAGALERADRSDGAGFEGAAEAARVITAAVATTIAARAHQLHGAIGTTQEYDLHRLTKPLWAGRDVDEPERQWAARLGARAVADGEAHVWDVLTAPAHPTTAPA